MLDGCGCIFLLYILQMGEILREGVFARLDFGREKMVNNVRNCDGIF